MDLTPAEPPVAPPTPSEDDVLAFLAGFADADTEHRVVAAALTDPALRSRLAAHEALLAAGDAALASSPSGADEAALAARAAALRGRLWEPEETQAAPLQPLADRLRDAGRRILDFVGGPLTLPGLAPALAAPAADPVEIYRQTFDSPEGARVELQQLPGDPPRLRAIVDVGGRSPDAAPAVATLRFADGPESQALLAVRLNADGRGLLDVFLTGEAAALPPALHGWRLVAVEVEHEAA